MTAIAVTGATGQLGRLAIEALKRRGEAPLALARAPERAAHLGVETRTFDHRAADPAALAGVEVLVLISSNDFDDRLGQHPAAIAAARTAGVGRIVYTSILGGTGSPLVLAGDHAGTERALAEPGPVATILRNGWSTENHTMGLAARLAHGAVLGSARKGLFSTAPRADFAEAIAVAVGEAHAGRTYELAGDTAYSLVDYAAEGARQSGRPVVYQDLPQGAYAEALQGFGLRAGLAHALADSDARAAEGALFDASGTLSRRIGRPTRPMAEVVRKALAAL